MKILPAIDIKGGKCVRLIKGDFDQITAATITSRSVINSAYNVLHYLKQHPEIW